MKGRLIVFEGIDGCGKTTQINHLASWLPISGLIPESARLHITREPGGTALGEALRTLLLHPAGDKAPEALTELLLYAADRSQHITQLIGPALERGDWVLTDRFSGSPLAYQGYGRGLNIEIINTLELIATNGLTPDITLWLDLPVSKSIERRSKQSKDRIESEGINFLARVAAGFEKIAAERNWVAIPANHDSILVSKNVEKEILKWFTSLKEKI